MEPRSEPDTATAQASRADLGSHRAPDPALSHPLPPLARQAAHGTILRSAERAGLTPVFGTSVPPAGLSGQLRRLAYRGPEDRMRRWLLLTLADRVDVGEGLLSDLGHGHVPNLWTEMGLRAEWRHRRWRLLVRLCLLTLALGLLWRVRGRRPQRGGRG